MSATVAMHQGALDAIYELPKSIQSKVSSFVKKFMTDSTSAGINLEKINGAADPNLRSARIDQAYRAILLKPETGNQFILLWIDHHDAAYDWAERKKVAVHPDTGVIQLYTLQEGIERVSSTEDEEPTGLFADIRDRELVKLGLPEDLLDLVRSFETDAALMEASDQIPADAYDALMLVAIGEPLEDVLKDLDQQAMEAGEIFEDDFEAALNRDESKREFVIVDDDELLESMLNAPLEKWRVFLHPSQRKLVEMNANGPVRVTGGAGTGKTVVAIHRAKRLAEQVFTGENDRILFTTYTRNLALDVEQQLASITDERAMERIRVVNIDQWVVGFLGRAGYKYKPAYGNVTDECWDLASASIPEGEGLTLDFAKEEFYAVVLPGGIVDRVSYLKKPRVGRGTPLGRKQRAQLWPVFEQYRNQLADRGLKESDDMMRDARGILEEKRLPLPYKAIVVDEAQDMSPETFRLIRAMIPGGDQPNDLFIVGDAHQRIYGHPVVLSHCGINVVGRGRRLRINYRTPEEVRNWSVGLLSGMDVDDLDGGHDTLKGYYSLMHGDPPKVEKCATFKDEMDRIVAEINDIVDSGAKHSSICVVARTNTYLDQIKAVLSYAGIPTRAISRDKPDNPMLEGVRIATMHRVKGLEFDHMIIAAVNEGVVPLDTALAGTDDKIELHHRENRERSLLYVAATRAKKSVLVTSSGTPSRWLG